MKYPIIYTILFASLMALSLIWPLSYPLILIFLCSVFEAIIDWEFVKKNWVLVIVVFVGCVPSIIIKYDNSNLYNIGCLLFAACIIAFMICVFMINRREIKETQELKSREDEVLELFGQDYLQYKDKTNEEIKEIKDKDDYEEYCLQKRLEFMPVINKIYNESEVNSLLDTFFILDKYPYIAGLSHGYKEADIKKYIKDRKISFIIDRQAQYVLDYNFNEPEALKSKITIKINEKTQSIEKIVFTSDLKNYSNIEEKLEQYTGMIVDSTLFKLRDNAEEDKTALFCKYITNTKNEFFNIDIVIKENDNETYLLYIALSSSLQYLSYYEDEKYTLQTNGSAKERIRKNTTIPQTENTVSVESVSKNETCYVYLMVDTTNHFYKIGISNNPEYRERTLQSEKPTIEKVCAKEYPHRKIAESIEKALHSSFANKRIRGEWFNLEEEEVEMIKSTLSG